MLIDDENRGRVAAPGHLAANVPGDQVVNGVSVTADFKGPGRDRAVYRLDLR